MPDPKRLTLEGEALTILADGRYQIARAWGRLAESRCPVDLVLAFRELTEHAARVEEMLRQHVEGKRPGPANPSGELVVEREPDE